MSKTGATLVALFCWLPLAAFLVLVGVAFGWWAAVLGAAPFVVFGLLAIRHTRQARDRPPADPAAIRAELAELDRRSTPWIKAWASCFLAVTAVGVVLLLVTAFQMR